MSSILAKIRVIFIAQVSCHQKMLIADYGVICYQNTRSAIIAGTIIVCFKTSGCFVFKII